MESLMWWADELMIPGAMLLLGFGIMYWGKRVVKKSVASRRWPATEGEITVSQLDQSTMSSSSSNSDTVEARYSTKIRYKYRVRNEAYTGSNVRLIMPLHRSAESVQPLLDRYPEGKKVTVYYDPEDPSTAVLETVVDLTTHLPFYIGIVWSVIWGVVLMIAAIMVYFKDVRVK